MGIFVIVCALLYIGVFVDSIKLEVPNNGVERCFAELFAPDTLITGAVDIFPASDSMTLSMKITETAEGGDAPNLLTERKEIATHTSFSFTSQVDHEYLFCFKDTPRGSGMVQNRIITVVWSDKTKDTTELAKKENLKPIEYELEKMEELVKRLKSDFDYMKDREALHRDTNESTNSRVVWLSILSILIVASLGVAQIYYFKSYFKSKKLI